MTSPPLRVDDVPDRLRALRAEAGDPSFAEIARRVSTLRRGRRGAGPAIVSRATVYDCFREGRKRFDTELVVAIVRALASDPATVQAWSSAMGAMQLRAASAGIVQVTDAPATPVPLFIGRARELATLREQPSSHWIHAMPGAGKSTLALRASHDALAAGSIARVIVADLRGHSPAGPPADPDAVVRAALRLLGESSRSLPTAAARRLLPSLLRAQATLLLLDDAESAEQVNAILPDPAGAAAIVTSRSRPSTTRFRVTELPLFTPAESLALLDAVAGPAVIDEDRPSITALLQLTEHQPLAVSITAARIASRPDWAVAEHLELARARRAALRLDSAVARSLDLTYESLPDAARRLLRAIAAHPVGLLDRDSVAALAGLPPSDVDVALAELERHGLVGWSERGRVTMHELVRVHAADRGLEADPASVRRAAAERLRQRLIDLTWSAHRTISEARLGAGRSPRTAVAHVELDRDGAERWLADSTDLLLHAALDAPAQGAPAAIGHIAEALDDVLLRAGRTDDAEALHREALRVARERGDPTGELRALVDLGVVLTTAGRVAEATEVLSQLDRETQAWHEEAALASNALALCLLEQGAIEAGRRALEAGMVAAARAGDMWREGRLRNTAALLHLRTGAFAEARAALERSIAISAACGDVAGAARGGVNLAKLLHDLGDDAAAETEAQRALEAMRALGFVPGVLAATSNLAAAVCALGRFDEAAALATDGLEAARAAGMRQVEVELLRTLGAARLGLGRIDDARSVLTEALRSSEPLGDVVTVAGCEEDLGDAALAAGEPLEAERHWQRAAARYAVAGAPYEEGVRAKLARLAVDARG
ncbi:tetratricopeptide repeat protein [Agrococcus sp. Marseille-Q4369]|uniref:tetratricopeptide repeat protein n=1 Tax=Agrococcus sp. Marseille-Q4369 TaxID=2810513 RepID=UPI001B8BB60B|nr:tetratricopeptide repeat protein [Agrococcus sp. Marseille-Q4369]QUW18590.1 hypothetical protein JSQ78_12465 [Agrococcus sp. Marseille-Q4369]